MTLRFIGSLVLAAAFVLLSCAKKSEEAAPPAPIPTAAEPQPAPFKAAAASLRCDKVVSQAIRDKYLAGTTLTEKKTGDTNVACSFAGGGMDVPFSIVFACVDTMVLPETIAMTKDSLKKNGYQDLAGVGRAAVQNGDLQIALWDDDTNCQVTMTGIGFKGSMIDLAKDLVAAVNAAALQ